MASSLNGADPSAVEPVVGYVMVEAEDLLRLCVETYDASDDKLSLAINGTVPAADLAGYVSRLILSDPKHIGIERFDESKLLYLESWSELFTLGCLGEYFNAKIPKYHWQAGIGIETAYKRSELREKYLGDGILACDDLGSRQIVQECKAQNLKGGQSGGHIQVEIIDRINAKLRKHFGDEVAAKKLLVVSIFGIAGVENSFDFAEIYESTIAAQSLEIFNPVMCVVVETANPLRARIYQLHPRALNTEEFQALSYEINFNPA